MKEKKTTTTLYVKFCLDHSPLFSTLHTDPCTVSYCGTNAQCRTSNHQALCSCPPGLDGNPIVKCESLELKCVSSASCGHTSVCIGGFCTAKCSSASDEACLQNEVCHEGVCTQICSSSLQCGNGRVCLDRKCVEGCDADAQCDSSLVCSYGKCVGE